jgi:tetratricopeptide (TPR) repeat protein
MKQEQHVIAAVMAALVLGCAGAQKRDVSAPSAALPDEATNAADPVAVAAARPQVRQVDVTSEQRAAFEAAAALYAKVSKGGALAGPDCDTVAAAFRKVADDAPGLLIARHNEAAIYFQCGRKAEAMQLWQELGRAGYAAALAQLGYSAWQNGEEVDAERYFLKAIQADPQVASIPARINLAQILRRRARAVPTAERLQYNRQAITHLRSVLALDGNSLQAYATLCYIYWDLELPDAAILVGQQAIARAMEIVTGKLDDADAIVDSEAAAKEAGKRRGRGAKADKGKQEEAPPSEEGKKIVIRGTGWTAEMKRWIGSVHNTLGLIDLNKKRTTQAIQNFTKAVELDPELGEARLNLAAISLKYRDYPTATANLRITTS